MSPARQEEERLLQRLRDDCLPIAQAFGLCWASVKRTRADAKLYGCCDIEGHIRIRLRSRSSGEFLRYSSLIATMCHELAHLKHMDHGPAFRDLNQRLLRWARAQGIYLPERARQTSGTATPAWAASAPPRRRGRRRRSDPRQGTLFAPPER